MQVFKTYFKIAKKHSGAILIYTAIFIGLLNIFVSQQKDNNDQKFESSKVKIALFDHDESLLSKSLVEFLSDHHTVVKTSEELDNIRDMIYQRSIEYVLIIPKGFEDSLLNPASSATDGLSLSTYRIPGSTAAMFVDSQVNRFINIDTTYRTAGFDAATAKEKTIETLRHETDINLNQSEKKTVPVVHIFYSYLSYILISIITLCISPIIIVFNQEEISNRTNLSSTGIVKRNFSLASASFLFAIVIFAVFIAISFMMFSSDMTTGIGTMRIFNAFLHTLAALSFAFLLSTFVTSSDLLAFISNFVGLAGGFLCGIFIERSLLGKTVINIGKVFVAHWYINVENELTKYGSFSGITDASFRTISYGLIIQLLFTAVFFALGMVISKSKRTI